MHQTLVNGIAPWPAVPLTYAKRSPKPIRATRSLSRQRPQVPFPPDTPHTTKTHPFLPPPPSRPKGKAGTENRSPLRFERQAPLGARALNGVRRLSRPPSNDKQVTSPIMVDSTLPSRPPRNGDKSGAMNARHQRVLGWICTGNHVFKADYVRPTTSGRRPAAAVFPLTMATTTTAQLSRLRMHHRPRPQGQAAAPAAARRPSRTD